MALGLSSAIAALEQIFAAPSASSAPSSMPSQPPPSAAPSIPASGTPTYSSSLKPINPRTTGPINRAPTGKPISSPPKPQSGGGLSPTAATGAKPLPGSFSPPSSPARWNAATAAGATSAQAATITATTNTAAAAGAAASGIAAGTAAVITGAAAAAALLAGGALALAGSRVSEEEQKANWEKLPSSYRKKACSLIPNDPLCQDAPEDLPSEAITGGEGENLGESLGLDLNNFTGGQEPGVQYQVSLSKKSTFNWGASVFSQVVGGQGPISWQEIPGPNDSANFRLFGAGQLIWESGNSSYLSPGYNWRIDSIARADGQPDTYGAEPLPPQTAAPVRPVSNKIANPPPATPDFLPSKIPTLPPLELPNLEPPRPSELPEAEPVIDPLTEPEISPPPAIPPKIVPGEAPPITQPEEAPKSTPGPLEDLGTSIPPLIMPAVTPTETIKDATKPGSFTSPVIPPTENIETSTDNGCKCNGPILQGQSAQNAQLAAISGQLTTIQANQQNPVTGFAALQAGQAGILGFLTTMQSFAETAWRATHMDKVINMLTLITVLHNATMLSRDVAETLFFVIGQGLQIIGIKDENDSPLNIGEVVGGSVNNWIRSILGDAFTDGLIDTYRKANRIVQSASAVIWTIRSLQDSSLDLLEWVGEHTGKIGNALKAYGVVGERSYNWMSERPQAGGQFRSRFDKLNGQLQNAEDRISVYAQATSSVVELQEETGQLAEQFSQFKTSVTEGIPDPWTDNAPVADQAATAATASQSPAVAPADATKGNPP